MEGAKNSNKWGIVCFLAFKFHIFVNSTIGSPPPEPVSRPVSLPDSMVPQVIITSEIENLKD